MRRLRPPCHCTFVCGRSHLAKPSSNRAGRALLIAYGMSETAYQFSPEEHPLLPGSPYSPAHPPWRRGVVCGRRVRDGDRRDARQRPDQHQCAEPRRFPRRVRGGGDAAAGDLRRDERERQSVDRQSAHPVGDSRRHAGRAGVCTRSPHCCSSCSRTSRSRWSTRAANGLSAAALITVSIYYLFQVFPPKLRPVALVVGIALTQLGTPLARLFPVEMLAQHHWRNLHLIELAIPLADARNHAGVSRCRRATGARRSSRCDFVTIVLLVPAMLLICNRAERRPGVLVDRCAVARLGAGGSRAAAGGGDPHRSAAAASRCCISNGSAARAFCGLQRSRCS